MRTESCRCANVLTLKLGVYDAFGVSSCIYVLEAASASPAGVRMYERSVWLIDWSGD